MQSSPSSQPATGTMPPLRGARSDDLKQSPLHFSRLETQTVVRAGLFTANDGWSRTLFF